MAEPDLAEELERAAIRLSDAITGGGIHATHGTPRDRVMERLQHPSSQIADALERLNRVLRDLDKRRKTRSPAPSTDRMGEELAEELERLAAGATQGPWQADLHHTVESAGRTYGWLRGGNQLVPLACVTLGVEGVPQDEGRSNATLIVALRNNLPAILTALRDGGG